MSVSPYLLTGIAVATALWLVYRALLSTWKDYRVQRLFLLSAVVAVAVLPSLSHYVPSATSALQLSVPLPEFSVGESATLSDARRFPNLLITGYLLVALGIFAAQLAGTIRVLRQIRRGTASSEAGFQLVRNTGIGPGTLGHRIFLPGATAERPVIQHELGHIRAGHRFDLLLVNLSCCVFWMNPGIWALRRELRLVHEFEADQVALSETGDAEAYARLLLGYVMGVAAPSYSHAFFHHPIKQRITMLLASKPGRAARMRRTITVSLAASMILAAGLFVRCKPESTPEPLTMKFDQPRTEQPASGVLNYAEKMPEFDGDLATYLGKELRYPDAARKAGTEGRSVLQFVVTDAGKVTDVRVVKSSGSGELDREAIRVVSAMPDWKPGMNDNKAVSVKFTLPITFKLNAGPGNDTRTGQASGTFSSPGLKDHSFTMHFSQP